MNHCLLGLESPGTILCSATMYSAVPKNVVPSIHALALISPPCAMECGVWKLRHKLDILQKPLLMPCNRCQRSRFHPTSCVGKGHDVHTVVYLLARLLNRSVTQRPQPQQQSAARQIDRSVWEKCFTCSSEIT